MGIGSGTAALIGGLASAGGSVASGIMGSNAASGAAQAQAQAAEQAAQLQYQESQNALDFQKQQFNTTQQNLAPWLQTGSGALSKLAYLTGVSPSQPQAAAGGPSPAQFPSSVNPGAPSAFPGTRGAGLPAASGVQTANPGGLRMAGTAAPTASSPTAALSAPALGGSPATSAPAAASASPGGYGSLLAPYGQTFEAPTEAQMEANDPGYQARMNLGQQTMEQSAAARGNLLTGGTAQAENQLAQDYASNEYNNFYNQALGQYTTNYNAYNQGQANQFNRLASMAGMGQTTAGQLGNLGQENANAMSNNLLTTGQMMGQDYQNAGAANASGIVGSANALGGAIGGATSGLSQMAMLQALLGGGGGGSAPSGNELTAMGV